MEKPHMRDHMISGDEKRRPAKAASQVISCQVSVTDIDKLASRSRRRRRLTSLYCKYDRVDGVCDKNESVTSFATASDFC